MKKVLRVVKIIALLISAIEIICYGIFITFYISNFQDLQTNLSVESIGYISIGLVLLHLGICAILLYVIDRNKQKNDLKIIDILGLDIKEAYLFGELGFVLTDKNNQIIYISEIFEDMNLHILNNDVFDWVPDLKGLLEEKKTQNYITVVINEKYFKVIYLKESHLFIFKDTTELETTFKFFQKNSLVLGIIMIDNYSEIAQNNEDINNIIPSIKNAILDYSKKFNFVIRAFKSDSFFVVMKYENLQEILKDNFSILNTVRNIGTKEDYQTSLSIGIAYGYPTVYQLNDNSSNALSVAMSRGGDQVVIAQLDHELSFYGGKSEATESRNKVKVKSDSNTLLSFIGENDDIYIMGHTDMDMDALGACLGIKALCDYKKKNARIVYDAKRVEKKTRGAFNTSFNRNEISKLIISPKDAIESCNKDSLVIVVDVNRPSIMMCKELLEKTEKIIIIDHHRRGNEFPESLMFGVIDTSASSASELIAELIKFGSNFPPIPLSEKFATIMLSGIFLDTNFFKSKTVGVRTFEASMILREYGADNSKADDFLKDEFEEYAIVNDLLLSLKNYEYGVVYCEGRETDFIERANIAKACNQCIQLKDNQAAFVFARTSENEILMSARSDGSINVQLILEKMGGGGHFTMAGASFKDMDLKAVEKILLDTLKDTLDDARNSENKEK